MPKDEFDVDDPFEAVAVELPCDQDTLVPMAEAFIEEFMWMGYRPDEILGLFQDPRYGGPLLATRAKGTAFVKELIAATFQKWGKPLRCRPDPAAAGAGSQSHLPVKTTEIVRGAANHARPEPPLGATLEQPVIPSKARNLWKSSRTKPEIPRFARNDIDGNPAQISIPMTSVCTPAAVRPPAGPQNHQTEPTR